MAKKTKLCEAQPRFTLVDGDDWVGLYKDGVLLEEGHRILLRDLAKYAGIDFERVELSSDNMEWLGERGGFPMDLGEVPHE